MKNVIIVADDSVIVRNVVKKALQNDYNVIEAYNGNDVIDIIKDNIDNVCCLLLDLNMPMSNGFVVLDYFKNNNLFNQIPVSIISGDDTKETIEKAFTYDIVDMLNKPFSVDNIKNVVYKTLEKGNIQ